jgi:hypothetical protein
MAHIHKDVRIEADPAAVWSALRDWGALHERLVPGFVVDTRLDGEDRIVTFFNGAVAREVLVARDDDARRLAWSIVDGPYSHHNGVAQVFAEDGGTRFVWSADLLPDAAAATTAEMMERGIQTAKETLERAA